VLGLTAAAVAVGCGAAQPVPSPNEPEPEPAVEPEPPPPCERLAERCRAEDSTEARLPAVDYAFTPPEDWVYAQMDEATIAQVDAEGPVLLLTSLQPASEPAKLRDQRRAAIEQLAELAEISLPQAKVLLFQPDGIEEFAGLEMSMWQRNGAKRANASGPLLVFSAEVEDNRHLFGIGFVPDADETRADVAIMDALKSIKPATRSGADDEEAETDSD